MDCRPISGSWSSRALVSWRASTSMSWRSRSFSTRSIRDRSELTFQVASRTGRTYPPRSVTPHGAGVGVAGARLHDRGRGARAADGALRLPGRGAHRAVAVPGRDGRRRDRRDARPALAGQGAGAAVRRRAARQHRRLPDLRVRADGAALDRRLPARRTRGAAWWRRCRWSRPASSSAARDAKTDDHFFLGFPSATGTSWPSTSSSSSSARWRPTVVLLALAVLVFVPIKYVYPSRTEKLWYTNMALATAFLVLFGAITSQLPDVPFVLDRAVAGLPRLLRRHQHLADASRHRECGGAARC